MAAMVTGTLSATYLPVAFLTFLVSYVALLRREHARRFAAYRAAETVRNRASVPRVRTGEHDPARALHETMPKWSECAGMFVMTLGLSLAWPLVLALALCLLALVPLGATVTQVAFASMSGWASRDPDGYVSRTGPVRRGGRSEAARGVDGIRREG